jgi:hypothetical protein
MFDAKFITLSSLSNNANRLRLKYPPSLIKYLKFSYSLILKK